MLRSYNRPGTKVRKWWVNPAALKASLTFEPQAIDAELGEYDLRIETLEKRLQALRDARQGDKNRLIAIERHLGIVPANGSARQSSAKTHNSHIRAHDATDAAETNEPTTAVRRRR